MDEGVPRDQRPSSYEEKTMSETTGLEPVQRIYKNDPGWKILTQATSPCESCKTALKADHEWVDLDLNGFVVNCSRTLGSALTWPVDTV